MEQLNEGLRFGNKEIQEVKDNIELFQMGVEYEFVPDSEDYVDNSDIEQSFDNFKELIELIGDSVTADGTGEPLFGSLRFRASTGIPAEETYYVWLESDELPADDLIRDGDGIAYSLIDILRKSEFWEDFLVYTAILYNVIRNTPNSEEVEEILMREFGKTGRSFDNVETVLSMLQKLTALELVGYEDDFDLSLIVRKGGEDDDLDEIVDATNIEQIEQAIEEHYIQKFNNGDVSFLAYPFVSSFAVAYDEFSVYENDGYTSPEDVYERLPENLKSNITSYNEEESGRIVEMVTAINSIPEGLEYMQKMFGYIQDNGNTDEGTGLHISISIKNPEKTDLVKFLILSKTDYIVDEFEPRNHVEDIMSNVESQTLSFVSNYFSDIDVKSIITDDNNYESHMLDSVVDYLENSAVMNEKYQSIKFGDYSTMDGRIELRYFGGRDYQFQFKKYERHIYRALYILLVSSTDLYEKEYRQALYKVVHTSLKKNGVEESLDSLNRAKKLYKTTNVGAMRRFVKRLVSGDTMKSEINRIIYNNIINVLLERIKELESGTN